MNPEAIEMNEIIKKHPAVYELLSERGKAIFFPKKGILSQSADAKGKKINATIGIALEDDGSSMRLSSIQKQLNISPEMAFPYAPSYGRQDIREKWKSMLYEKNPSLKGKEISLPIVTCALTHGLSMVGYLFLDKQDKVVTPDLFWENYELIFKNNYDAELELFQSFDGDKFNIKALKSRLEAKKGKIVLLLNFPNNPTGYTPTIDEAKSIVKIIEESADKGNNILVIIDDAYFGLVYEDNIIKESIFSMLADLHENVLAVKVDGPTKEEYVWGFRVGFITYGIKNSTKEIYTALESKTAGAIRSSISNAPNLSQSLLLNAYNSPDYKEEKKEKYKILKKRYEEVKKILKNKKYKEFFEPLPFNSGYFMCVQVKKGINAEQVRQTLLKKYDTGVIVFNDLIRIAFSATPTGKIPELFENIYNACKDECQN